MSSRTAAAGERWPPYSTQQGYLPPSGESDDERAPEEFPRMERRHYNPPMHPTPIPSPPNPLAVVLANLISKSANLAIQISKKLYTNSSVIILSAGLAGGVHYLASQYYPLANAATDPSIHGSVAIAKYVGLTFLIQEALKPIHKAIDQSTETVRARINIHAVRYLTPIALAWIVAYHYGMPVKFAAATLYTMGTFAAMKLLNRGYVAALYRYELHSRGLKY